MTTRWEVERAVMRTNIKPLGRLIVFALLSKVDNETAMVPPEFTPSLSTLVAATGLAKSAVAEHLKYLEGLGWVKRSSPSHRTRYDRTHYALLVGREDPMRPSSPPCGQLLESDVRDTDRSFAAETGAVPDVSSPPRGQPVVRDADSSTDATEHTSGVVAGSQRSVTRTAKSSSPPHGHASTKNSPPKSTTNSSSAAPAEGAKRGTRLPVDFRVTPEMVAWARERAPSVDGRMETEKFTNYWHAKSGKDATKLDWVATWRVWMLTAQGRASPNGRANGNGPHRTFTNPTTADAYDGEL